MQQVGTVAQLWRFPVKSMRGEQVASLRVDPAGVHGDRAHALVDVETGKVVSAKDVRRFPRILDCRARYAVEPRDGRDASAALIEPPDGRIVDTDSERADALLSDFFRRDVRLARSAPEDFTIDQFHPDLENLDPQGHRNTVVEQKLGSALFAQMGMPSPLPPGSFLDVFPLSMITTATLRQLQALRPQTRFDVRRFRMNVLVEVDATGFVENAWLARTLALGHAVTVRAAMADPRCVMTTLAQEELPNDTGVLHTLARHSRLDIGGGAMFPCAGVYASVERAGVVRVGEVVALAHGPDAGK